MVFPRDNKELSDYRVDKTSQDAQLLSCGTGVNLRPHTQSANWLSAGTLFLLLKFININCSKAENYSFKRSVLAYLFLAFNFKKYTFSL